METNIVYNDDNLKVMDSLPGKSIDLIYIDPPFNTGRRDFGYIDSFDTTEGFVQWLSLRLGHCYLLLKDTGVLCVHLDYRTVHYVKVALDRYFGEKNFVNELIWAYKGGTNLKKGFLKKHDTILVYSKSDNFVFNSSKYKSYTKEKNRKEGLSNRGLASQMFYKDSFGVYCFSKMTDVLNISMLSTNSKERVGYSTQKPLELLKLIIKSFTNENDLVADFFCGSGTTLVAAKQLGRKYLGCDISKKAIEITRKRLGE